jgi:hypothetical protein
VGDGGVKWVGIHKVAQAIGISLKGGGGGGGGGGKYGARAIDIS